LAAAIAAETFAAECDVRAVRMPRFKLKDAIERTQIQVFGIGHAFDLFDRATAVGDPVCQIGVFKKVTVTDGEPDDDEVDALLLLSEQISLFALQKLSGIAWASPVTVESTPLYDLEMLSQGDFLSVITVTNRTEIEL
jgi:hypothetical protein